MITDNGNNTYGVRYYVNGTAEYVTVSNLLANGGTEFNYSTNGLWASLAEQGYAQIQASGVITGNSSYNYGNSFSTIGNGGFGEYTLAEITGATQITDFDGGRSSWSKSVYNSSLNYVSGASGLSNATVLSAITTALAAGDDVLLGSNTDAYDSQGRQTLVSDHELSIYGYDSSHREPADPQSMGNVFRPVLGYNLRGEPFDAACGWRHDHDGQCRHGRRWRWWRRHDRNERYRCAGGRAAGQCQCRILHHSRQFNVCLERALRT